MFQSLNWLDDEDVQFEKTCTKGLLTPEEIEDLKFDESLSEVDRILLIISDGGESQKISLANSLPEVLTEDPCLADTLLPKFVEMIESAGTELLNICGQCIAKLLKCKVVSPPHTVAYLTPLMWTHINSKDTLVHNTWLETLITFILVSEKSVLQQTQVISLALAKGNLSQKSSSRIACAKLLTALCQRIDRSQMESEIFPAVRMLCQDIDYDVRCAMCCSLVQIAQSIGEVRTMKLLVPEIQELLQDEEITVRNTAIQVLIDIVPLLSKDVVATIIGPIIWPYFDIVVCERPSSMLVTVTQLFGRLGVNMAEVMDDVRRDWYVRYFIKLCKMEHPSSNGVPLENGSNALLLDITMDTIMKKDTDIPDSISYLCAFNFPAVCYNVGAKFVVESNLLECYTALSKHHHFSVRRALAAGFHEVAKILVPDTECLLPIYTTLVRDPSIKVQQALIANMGPALISLNPPLSLNKGALPVDGLTELIEPLLQQIVCISKTREWRSYTSLIEAWSDLTEVLSPEQIHQHFAPHLIKQLSKNVMLPVRRAMLRTLIKFIFKSKYLYQRNEMTSQLIKGLSKCKKFNQRLLFVEFCYLVLDKFSKKFFKEHCFTPALLLINDPIPCVRIRSSTLLPHLKSQLKMPSDRPMLQQLEASSRRSLMSERNKDVLAHIQKAVIELDNGDVTLDSEPDPEDRRREEQQNFHIVKEERDVRSRISLPEHVSSLDLRGTKPMQRKGSMASLTNTDSAGRNNRRKMSISSRRSSTSVPRRASMPSRFRVGSRRWRPVIRERTAPTSSTQRQTSNSDY